MNAWSLALTNLNVIPKDERQRCKQCGARFEKEKTSRSAYCSTACQEAGAAENKRAAALRAKERKKQAKLQGSYTTTCEHCHTVFTPKAVTQRFCSRSCSATHNVRGTLYPFKRKEEYASA